MLMRIILLPPLLSPFGSEPVSQRIGESERAREEGARAQQKHARRGKQTHASAWKAKAESKQLDRKHARQGTRRIGSPSTEPPSRCWARSCQPTRGDCTGLLSSMYVCMFLSSLPCSKKLPSRGDRLCTTEAAAEIFSPIFLF